MQKPLLILAAAAAPLLLAACVRFQQGPVDYGLKPGEVIEVDGQKLRYLDVGEGDPVVLIHGFGSAIEAWAPVLPALKAGHRVVALDLPGFGKSDKTARDYSPQALAMTVFRLMKKLGIEKADIVAHSWGSSIALALARARPMHVGRLVLVGAWVFEEQQPPYSKWAKVPGVGELIFAWTYKELIARRIALGFYDPEKMVDQKFVEAVEKALDRPGTVAAALAATRGQKLKGMEEEYARVTQPVLLVWGEEDEVSRPVFGEKLLSILPDARLVFIPRCGHIPMVEAPAQFSGAVLDFLGEE